MKRTFILLVHILLVILLIQVSAQAKNPFSFRLNLGGGFISAGDINTIIDSHNSLFEETASCLGLNKKGNFKKINWGPDLEGEFIFHLQDNIGVGLSSGYILRKASSKVILDYESIYYNITQFKPEISAVPVKLSFYYFHPVFSKIRLFVRCGIGIYLGQMNYLMDMDETILGFNYLSETKGDVTAKGLGLHGAIGMEYSLGKNLFVFFEGKGRYAELKKWKGQEVFLYTGYESEIRSGTLWYYENFNEDLGKSYSNIRLLEEKPTGSSLKNVREFSVSLSGFTLSTGIRIRF
jgi:hypothetical protein